MRFVTTRLQQVVRRFQPPVRTAGWRSIGLRWRRRRPRREMVARRATTLHQITVWQPHLHFHLSTSTVRAHERDRWHDAPVAREQVFGVVRQLHETTTSLYSTSVQTRWLRTAERRDPQPRARRANGRPSRPMPWPGGEMMPPVITRTMPRSARPAAVDRSIAAALAPTRTGARPGLVAASVEWQRPVRRGRPAGHSQATDAITSEHQQLVRREPVGPRRFMQPAQIVWRSAAQPRHQADTVVASPRRPSVPIRASANAVATESLATHRAPVGSPGSAAVRYTDFEPGLLDRLTNDVIHRVERRVRIERERRGL